MKNLLLTSIFFIFSPKFEENGFIILLRHDGRETYEEWLYINSIPKNNIIKEKEFNKIMKQFKDTKMVIFNDSLSDFNLTNLISYNILINKGLRINTSPLENYICCEYNDTKKVIKNKNDSLSKFYLKPLNLLNELNISNDNKKIFKVKRGADIIEVVLFEAKVNYCICNLENDRFTKFIKPMYLKQIKSIKLASESDNYVFISFVKKILSSPIRRNVP